MQVLPRSKLFPEFWLHKQILGVNCIYIIMGNPVDISMYFVSRSQHACKVPCPKFPTLIGFRKFSTVTLFSWHQKRNVLFRGGSNGAFSAITAIPASNSVLSSFKQAALTVPQFKSWLFEEREIEAVL